MLNAYAGITDSAFDFWGSPVVELSNGTLFCPGFTGDTFSKNSWDRVAIQGQSTPGIVEVSVRKFRGLDKKKSSGTDGARLTFTGVEPAMVDIQILIWTPEQLKALQELWPSIFPKSNKRPAGVLPSSPWPPAFDCYHPQLKLHDVKSLVFISGEGPSPHNVPKARVFRISAMEFIPPGTKKVTATVVEAKGSINDPGANPPPGADDKNTGPT